ncbi:hypothetical protein JQ609_01155 [Bradyrhizobium sp. AUGA SZCCT0169]|uniref:hypothetical protein n=1 Tax=unclassified Bradyrhizobium TaxID=2631580 RepID=UPI001BAB6637|nr:MULTISPECIES: hypothetical protein [unclassified Bradyrhizobium]MBR1191886.1 hypothetical protein [Bradyrhizobium sp. AUGA SZCCT0160]MBR1245530.1 hypothetical protein [Bradyrhizobium sp. AUGA SZCCT0169]
MKFPIENGTRKPLTIFVELETLEKVIPSGGKAVVTLPDNPTSFLEVRDGLVVVWNNGPGEATIETWDDC